MGTFPKLFMTDLDGTALGGCKPYDRFPDELSALLDSLVRSGCSWTTNTTWEASSQLKLLHASSVTSRPVYVTGGSSLQLCRLQGDELVPVEPYSAVMAGKLREAVQAHLMPFIRASCTELTASRISFNGCWFAMTVVPEEAELLSAFLAQRQTAAGASGAALNVVHVTQEQRFYAHPAFLRKGTVLRELARLMELTPDDIVVAGDETMDLDMMRPELAKHVICPSNAHPEVKRRVLEMDGAVGEAAYGPGIVQAFAALAQKRGWKGGETFR